MSATFGSDSPGPVVLLDSYSHVLRSEIVGDDFQLSVLPPPSYQGSTDDYPVVYALDGPFTFGLIAHGSLLLVFDQMVPEMIVVSIGKPLASMYEWGPTRGRDYSPAPLPDDEGAGHADTFAECLVHEIIPFVEERYRARSGDRTLSGHSLGGVFALHVLFQRPGVFQRYLAISPAVASPAVRLIDSATLPPPGTQVPARLFTCIGTADHEYRDGAEQLRDELVGREYRDLRYEHATYPGLQHIATGAYGFLDGLRSVFAD